MVSIWYNDPIRHMYWVQQKDIDL